MYSILIVDDERNEREGIRKLLLRYKFEFHIYQASNGEEALKILQKEKIDVLLTDIKMPHLTGMELIEKTHQCGIDPITIIYSAYGEFEYAQNAISLGVMQYLLKPIRLEDFQSLFEKVMELCDKKEIQKEQNYELEQAKEISQRELLNQKLLLFLDGKIEQDELEEIINRVTPIIISSFSNRFSQYWNLYIKNIQNMFGTDIRIINRSDMELLLLVHGETIQKKSVELCEKLISMSKEQFQSDVFIVVGQTCQTLIQLKTEYGKLLEQLDYQFFVTESTYFLNGEGNFIKKKNDMLNLYFEKIDTCAKLRDFQGMKKEFEKTYEYVQKTIGFSSVYIKYNFSEIVKKCCETLDFHEEMVDVVEKIYGAYSIQDVKIAILELIDRIAVTEKEQKTDNRIVAMAKAMIQESYGDCSLSVASIAQRLNISPAYLSTLFKIESNSTLVKYISQYRIERAKELLYTTNMKIGDIAEQVGYLNSSYFISIFKTSEGCSPAKYREKAYRNEE